LVQLGVFLFANGMIGYLYERRRRAEQLTDEQREWFSTTLASIGDAVIATDLDGCVVYMNGVASRLTGWSEQEALRQDIQTVFHIVNEDTRLSVDNPALRAIRDGQIVGLANHTVLVSRDGTEMFIDDSGAPIKGPAGEPTGAVLIFRDITSRRQARRALEVSESRFRAAQETSLDAFTVLEAVRDSTGQIVDFRWTYANPEAGRILAHAPENLIGRRLLDVLPGNKNNSELFERYVQVVETGEPHDLELYYDSERITGWFRNMCVRLGDGVAVSFSDITERKRIEIVEREQRQLAETMRDIAIALGRTLNLADALKLILAGVQRIVPCETVDVMLCDSDGLIFVAGSGGYTDRGLDEMMRGFHFPYRDLPLLRLAAETRQPVVVPDIKDCPDWVPMDFEEWRCSYVCVPIQLQEEIIGFLNVTSLESDYFQVPLVERLARFAHQIALAVQNARLYERALEAAATRERERLARDLHDAVSQTLFAASIIAESLPRQWQTGPDKVM
ncbi:MAG: PAS domain S-box protein, partial [Chloroflexi bacterium]